MTGNVNRQGRCTSSEIAALLNPKKFMTYVAEVKMERMLGRAIETEVQAKPLQWGKFLEKRVFSLLGLEYTLSSTETDLHPVYGDIWAGSKDGTREGKERAITDIKCPMTMKSFCQLVLPLYLGYDGMEAMDMIRKGFVHEGIEYKKHDKAEDYYCQLVSNACINNTEYAELIVYMPYESELKEIQEYADGECYWVWAARPEELPSLPDGGTFRNVNIIRFKVPEEDKIALEKAVLKARDLIIGPTVHIKLHDPALPNTTIHDQVKA